MHTGTEFKGVDRLVEKIVGAGLKPFDLVCLLVQGRNQHDRDIFSCRIFFQLTGHFVPVQVRHHNIQQYQIRMFPHRLFDTHLPAGCGDDGILVLGKHGGQQFCVYRIIVDD